MGRRRKTDRHLPQRMYCDSGRYYFKPAAGPKAWFTRDLAESLIQYAQLAGRQWSLRTLGDCFARYQAEVVPLKAKRTPTKAERAHLAAVKALPCVACVIDDRFDVLTVCGPTEVHHTLSGNKRRGHMFVLPLGRWHHRAVPFDGLSARQMRSLHGPSLARESKMFRLWYGDDDALLARVNELLAQRRAA